MSTAKKFRSFDNQYSIFTDIFIDEIAEQTGCSFEFLEQARPAIERLYRDVQGEALETGLNNVKFMITQQAETEKSTQRATAAAKQLLKKHEEIDKNINSAQQKLINLKNNLSQVSSNVNTFGDNTVYKA